MKKSFNMKIRTGTQKLKLQLSSLLEKLASKKLWIESWNLVHWILYIQVLGYKGKIFWDEHYINDVFTYTAPCLKKSWKSMPKRLKPLLLNQYLELLKPDHIKYIWQHYISLYYKGIPSRLCPSQWFCLVFTIKHIFDKKIILWCIQDKHFNQSSYLIYIHPTNLWSILFKKYTTYSDRDLFNSTTFIVSRGAHLISKMIPLYVMTFIVIYPSFLGVFDLPAKKNTGRGFKRTVIC